MLIPALHLRRYVLATLRTLYRNASQIVPEWNRYISDYRALKKQSAEQSSGSAPSTMPILASYPCFLDRTPGSGRFTRYEYQDSWAFSHLLANPPDKLVDIASSKYFVAFASRVCPVEMVDLRPIVAPGGRVTALKGDIVALPYETGSVEVISTLSVIEHIGLGRYGDELDLLGMQKAAAELSRVLAPGGRLLVAFPTGARSEIAFNAHRILTPEDSIALFPDLLLEDEKYAVGMDAATREKYNVEDEDMLSRESYDRSGRPYAYGCYRFTKQSD